MIRQVYHVKKDENLKKKKDLAQDKEKPVIQEIYISASFVNQIVPDDEHTSR